MAELITLARPYAKAAFKEACDKSALSEWSEALVLLGALVREAKVKTFLASPAFTAKEKSAMLIGLCGKLNQGLENFVQILAENKRLALLPQVSQLFELFKADYEKTLDVEIVSAFELASATEVKLTKSMTERLSRKVKVQTRVDKKLIGGVIIYAGDTVIDGSVRGRLKKLAEAMKA